jgi:imidazolonepropionase-like amidohydrolase/pimeloyl-ACP methyl ester carboxylesterase
LRSRPDLIDSTRIGLLGHSQGTWIIAKVAARNPGVRFLVSLSGSGISAAEQETYRTGALMRADGFPADEIASAQNFQRQKFAVARTGLGWAALDSLMQRLRADSVRWFPGYGTGAAARTLAGLRLYGVLQFNYDPTRDLERVRAPVLVLMGARDLVFPPETTVARMRESLARGGNHDVTARILPELGHAFTTVQTYQGRPFRRAIAEPFLAELINWIPEHAGLPAQPPESGYLIRNVQVISMVSPKPVPADVVIRGRRIASISAPGTVRQSALTVIDGSNRFLIPGLIDSHVHIKENDPLFLFTVNGVTTVQNMAGRPFHLARRDSVARGTLLGPRIITAGPTTAQAGVETPEQARSLVAEQKRLGYDMIKMYGGRNSEFTPETYHALITAAHQAGMRVVGHAPRNLPFQTVLDEGQNSIDHMEEIVYTHRPFARLLKPYVDVQFRRGGQELYDSLARRPVPDFARELAPEIAALARAVKQAGIAVTPNIVFFRNIGWKTTDNIHALLRAPELAYATAGQRLNWSPLLNTYRSAFQSRRAVMSPYLNAATKLEEAITAAFYRAGVPIMTGTDSEFLGAQPGYGLHTELEIFTGLGMARYDALKAATVTPARVMGIADSVGTIEAGKIADLVLLDANPLVAIRNTRRVSGVFTAGRYTTRAQLQTSLDSLARSYGPEQEVLGRFMEALEKRGAAAAVTGYRTSPNPALIANSVERVLNSYGYQLLGQQRIQDAIEVFRLNTETFPNEYNTWDSLAEAYMTAGQNDLAIRYYRKVLELRPGDENATAMLRRLGVP